MMQAVTGSVGPYRRKEGSSRPQHGPGSLHAWQRQPATESGCHPSLCWIQGWLLCLWRSAIVNADHQACGSTRRFTIVSDFERVAAHGQSERVSYRKLDVVQLVVQRNARQAAARRGAQVWVRHREAGQYACKGEHAGCTCTCTHTETHM